MAKKSKKVVQANPMVRLSTELNKTLSGLRAKIQKELHVHEKEIAAHTEEMEKCRVMLSQLPLTPPKRDNKRSLRGVILSMLSKGPRSTTDLYPGLTKLGYSKGHVSWTLHHMRKEKVISRRKVGVSGIYSLVK